MKLVQVTVLSALIGVVLASGCGNQDSGASGSASTPNGAATDGTPAEMKDSEVRKYIETHLRPYLDSLAYQVCVIKRKVQADLPGREICPPTPDGYTGPKPNGKP
jgi:hypothetical protein